MIWGDGVYEWVNSVGALVPTRKRRLRNALVSFCALILASCAPMAVENPAPDGPATNVTTISTPSEDDRSERHAGYYYPPITSRERYTSRARVLVNGTDRDRRIGFVTAITRQQFTFGYPPQYTMYAKGDEAEKLIIVALGDQSIATIYQARAQLTAVARVSEFFSELGVETYFTFFDLARMLGFERLTISDRKVFTHRVEIE